MTSVFLSDHWVWWTPYNQEDRICDKYSIDVWHQAVHDIDSDEEWASFLLDSTIVNCYVLKRRLDNESIAFLYIKQENRTGNVVSVHGGGWENPLMYYRGYIMMLKHLLSQGLKVRTYAQLSNPRGIRFSRSVGFVPYRYSEEEVFMWISEKRLKSSKLYKRFYP